MTHHLTTGDVSPRTAYRWLRRLPRTHGDVYLVVEWAGPLGDDTFAALWALDLPCRTLRPPRPQRWAGRTRCWRGSQRRPVERRWPDVREADRPLGREYATLIARLLRAAHRDGTPVVIREGT